MRFRLVFAATLLAALVVLQPGRSAGADSDRPTVVIRAQSLDALIANARYVAELAGKEEEAKQAEGILKGMRGPNGLEGIDTTKPLGLYGRLAPAIPQSPFAILLPVADEKTFTDFLETKNLKGEKQDDGTFKVDLPNSPLPGYYRFANKYVYATVGNPANLDPKKLLPPEVALGGKDSGLISATFNIDQVPQPLRDFVVGEAARRAALFSKAKQPGETDAQHKVRAAFVDNLMTQFKSLLKDGKGVHLRLDVDRQAGEVSTALHLGAREGSPLADLIESLGKTPSVGASLVGTDAAVSGLFHLALPAKLRTALEPAIDEGLATALQKAPEEAKGLLEGLLKSITPSLKAAEIDSGFNVRGPSANGLYTLVSGIKVKDGMGIENALKEVVKVLPEDAKTRITLDVATVGKVSIHKLVPETVDPPTKALLGENPVYLAFRDDAILVGAGEKGLAALKEVVGAEPVAGLPFQFEASLSRLAPLLARENKGAPAAARKAFKGNNDDKVRVTLEGGKSLKLRLAARGPVLRFFALLDEMKKKEL